MTRLTVFILTLLSLAAASGCGKANGDSASARVIPGGDPGVTCYGIYDGDGSLKGGSCVKN